MPPYISYSLYGAGTASALKSIFDIATSPAVPNSALALLFVAAVCIGAGIRLRPRREALPEAEPETDPIVQPAQPPDLRTEGNLVYMPLLANRPYNAKPLDIGPEGAEILHMNPFLCRHHAESREAYALRIKNMKDPDYGCEPCA